MLTVTKIFEFEAAHHLPDYSGKCSNLHGHSYRLEVEVSGPAYKKESPKGMVCDFGDLKDAVNFSTLVDLDHSDLNEIIFNPTAENLIEEIVKRLRPKFKRNLIRIRLWETSNSYAEWRKDK